jgi:zinc transporter
VSHAFADGHFLHQGLICGFALWEPGRNEALGWEDIDDRVAQSDAVVWLHFNLANAEAKQWIERCATLPDAARAFLTESDDRVRIEATGEGIAGILSDVAYEFDFDPSHLATFRFYFDAHRLISARTHPLKSADQLRSAAREGAHFATPAALAVRLLQLRGEILADIVMRLERETDELEDEILAERIREQRKPLGRIRRLAVRLRRRFAPEHQILQRLGRNLPDWIEDADRAALREVAEQWGAILGELDAVQERTKLLQEELAAHVAEETNHNLVVLSIVTALFLPITLITGIFGMNVAGLPGLQNPHAFVWIALGMMVVAGATLALLRWRGLL